jgi:hypothetical protein
MATTITVQIRGTEGDDRLRLGDFIDQLNALEGALRQTERLMYGETGSVYYKITELRQESPAVISIEALPMGHAGDRTAPLVGRFLSYVELLDAGGALPPEMDLTALESFKNLAPTKKRHVSEFVVRNGQFARRLDKGFRTRVDAAIGPDIVSEGDVVGALEMINLHNEPRFAVFTTIRSRKVTCNFAPELKPQVIAALDRYVRVSGTLHYKHWNPYPHEVDVRAVDVYPREAELPQIDALAGANPDIVGDSTPEEFVKAMRNARW